MYLGEIIKKYRQSKKISMDEFARLSHLSKPYISMLENNKNSRSGKPIVPSVPTLKKVASAIGMTLDDLLKKLDDGQVIELVHEPQKNYNYHLDPIEISLIEKYRCLSLENQEAVAITINSLYKASVKNKIKEDGVT